MTSSASKPPVLSLYKSAPYFMRLFLYLRWNLTPYEQMEFHLPSEGTLLDLGCGHGLFTLMLAQKSSNRKVIGVDHDLSRIKWASAALSAFPNAQIVAGSILALPKGPFSGISLIDVLHYFDPKTQECLLRNVFSSLEPGGILILREVDPDGSLVSYANRLYEKLVTSVGFTRSEKKQLTFRSPNDWEALLSRCGFQVRLERCSHFLFADILYICERK